MTPIFHLPKGYTARPMFLVLAPVARHVRTRLSRWEFRGVQVEQHGKQLVGIYSVPARFDRAPLFPPLPRFETQARAEQWAVAHDLVSYGRWSAPAQRYCELDRAFIGGAVPRDNIVSIRETTQ